MFLWDTSYPKVFSSGGKPSSLAPFERGLLSLIIVGLVSSVPPRGCRLFRARRTFLRKDRRIEYASPQHLACPARTGLEDGTAPACAMAQRRRPTAAPYRATTTDPVPVTLFNTATTRFRFCRSYGRQCAANFFAPLQLLCRVMAERVESPPLSARRGLPGYSVG